MLSYILGSPAVALASATAFAVSETIDWAVYTITRRPFADRVLLSTACSAPVDTGVFLFMAHISSLTLFALGVSAKLTAGVIIWAVLRRRQPASANAFARGRRRLPLTVAGDAAVAAGRAAPRRQPFAVLLSTR